MFVLILWKKERRRKERNVWKLRLIQDRRKMKDLSEFFFFNIFPSLSTFMDTFYNPFSLQVKSLSSAFFFFFFWCVCFKHLLSLSLSFFQSLFWPKNHSLPLKTNCSFPNGLILLLKLGSFHKLSSSCCLGLSPSPLISAASLNCSSEFC